MSKLKGRTLHADEADELLKLSKEKNSIPFDKELHKKWINSPYARDIETWNNPKEYTGLTEFMNDVAE